MARTTRTRVVMDLNDMCVVVDERFVVKMEVESVVMSVVVVS